MNGANLSEAVLSLRESPDRAGPRICWKQVSNPEASLLATRCAVESGLGRWDSEGGRLEAAPDEAMRASRRNALAGQPGS